MTNKEFSLQNEKFKNACVEANIPSTRCQAKKWQRQTGLAYRVSKGELQPLDSPPGNPTPKNARRRRR